MKIRLTQKELKTIARHCHNDCENCQYSQTCRILEFIGATNKMAYRWENKDVKSIAHFIDDKNEKGWF